MRGKRAFFKDHTLQSPLVVFEQFRRAKVARDQDGITAQALRCGCADLTRNRAQQAVREIFEIVHPVCQQRIVDLAHPHPRVLLHAFDGCFSSQAAVDRLVYAPRPAFVIGEHLVGFEHLFVFAADAEFSLTGQIVDLFAHPVKRAVNPLTFGLGILGHDLSDFDTRLVIDGKPGPQPFHQSQAGQGLRPGLFLRQPARFFFVDQFGIGDQF